MKPKNECFNKIKKIPNMKHKLPRILLGLVKNVIVLCGPMMRTNPIMNKTFPKAKKPESKKVKIPNIKKKNPPAVKPTPNSTFVSNEYS